MIFDDIIKGIEIDKQHQNPTHLKAIVAELRSAAAKGSNAANESMFSFIELLKSDLYQATILRNYLVNLFCSYDQLTLFTDLGILPGHGFFAETFKRFKYKILPPLENKANAEYLINHVFFRKNDYKKLARFNEQLLLQLIEAINFEKNAIKWQLGQLNYLLNALMVLSQRITAIGLEPELVNKLPEIDDLQSPFFSLYREVQSYVDSFKNDQTYRLTNDEDYRQILVMCNQCEACVDQLHKYKDKYGISVNMAYLMIRLDQHIRRLKLVLKLIQQGEVNDFNETLITFVQEVVFAENKKYSIKEHFNENLSLIAYKITEHTSNKGEHYLTVNRNEYFNMLWSAMGGGFIVAFILLFKLFAHHLYLAPFGEALCYSLIYGFGFSLIHFLHFTLATKQPAMTANTIAASLDNIDKKDVEMLKTVQLISQISSAQFISFVGNIIVVIPAAFLIGWLCLFFTGAPLINSSEAAQNLVNIHPWQSGSLFYAAIAGMFLMAGGFISGYYDNKVVYSRIPERLNQHPFLIKIIPQKALHKLTGYLRNNLGVILGNFFLGVFLATAPLFGKFFGLPIDVRHVTLSAGSFGLSLQCLDQLPAGIYLLQICLGIALMGLINLLVSFGLAIFVAVRSRSLNTSLTKRLMNAIIIYFRAYPKSFFIPKREV